MPAIATLRNVFVSAPVRTPNLFAVAFLALPLPKRSAAFVAYLTSLWRRPPQALLGNGLLTITARVTHARKMRALSNVQAVLPLCDFLRVSALD